AESVKSAGENAEPFEEALLIVESENFTNLAGEETNSLAWIDSGTGDEMAKFKMALPGGFLPRPYLFAPTRPSTRGTDIPLGATPLPQLSWTARDFQRCRRRDARAASSDRLPPPMQSTIPDRVGESARAAHICRSCTSQRSTASGPRPFGAASRWTSMD